MTNPNKTGMLGAVVLAGFHLCWILLIMIGFAQAFMDFVFWAHMVKPVYIIQPFDPKAALTLLALTGAIGYLIGVLGGFTWNRLHRS